MLLSQSEVGINIVLSPSVSDRHENYNRQYGRDVCGPWGNGGCSAGWGSRGARPARRGKGLAVGIRQWKGIDVKEMLQNVGDGLGTTSSHVYAQSVYHCASCINHHTDNHNKNRVLL